MNSMTAGQLTDPYAASYLHCRVQGCPEWHLDNSNFCATHRKRKDRIGLPLRAPAAARKASGAGSVGSSWCFGFHLRGTR
jgi:hypothetical protein